MSEVRETKVWFTKEQREKISIGLAAEGPYSDQILKQLGNNMLKHNQYLQALMQHFFNFNVPQVTECRLLFRYELIRALNKAEQSVGVLIDRPTQEDYVSQILEVFYRPTSPF